MNPAAYILRTATTKTKHATYDEARAAQLAHPERLGSTITRK